MHTKISKFHNFKFHSNFQESLCTPTGRGRVAMFQRRLTPHRRKSVLSVKKEICFENQERRKWRPSSPSHLYLRLRRSCLWRKLLCILCVSCAHCAYCAYCVYRGFLAQYRPQITPYHGLPQCLNAICYISKRLY